MLEAVADTLRRVALQRSLSHHSCAHLATAGDLAPERATCSPCGDQGQAWVKLRMCLTCGAVGCCDSSQGRHARAHFDATGHPVIRSIEPGEAWAWCYPDRAYLGAAELRP